MKLDSTAFLALRGVGECQISTKKCYEGGSELLASRGGGWMPNFHTQKTLRGWTVRTALLGVGWVTNFQKKILRRWTVWHYERYERAGGCQNGPVYSHHIELHLLFLHTADDSIQLIVGKLSSHVREQDQTLASKTLPSSKKANKFNALKRRNP